MATTVTSRESPTAELISEARRLANETTLHVRATRRELELAALFRALADRLEASDAALAESRRLASAILRRVRARKGTPLEGQLSMADTLDLREIAGGE